MTQEPNAGRNIQQRSYWRKTWERPWISVAIYALFGKLLIVGATVKANVMVGIDVDSGNPRSDKRRSGKRRITILNKSRERLSQN